MSTRNSIGTPFIELPSVDSTNNYATALVHEGMAQHGTAVFAHEQTRGRGQRSKSWESNKSENIALSLVIDPAPIVTSQMFYLSMAVALGTYRFFNKHAGQEISIKWPNDLYWRDRKAGGILIENILSGSTWKYAIAGIGININQTVFGEGAGRAVSLKQITGKDFIPLDLARQLCLEIDVQVGRLSYDLAGIFEDYNKHLFRKNEAVRLKKGSRIFEARIAGVNDRGQLVVMHAVEEMFDVGEIEWMF